MNTRAAVIATTRAAHQPGGAPAPRDNSARPVPTQGSARNGGRAGVSQPCRQRNSAESWLPMGRGDCSPVASLRLPGASASGAFSAGVKDCLTTEPTGISGCLPLSGGLTSWRGRAHGTRTLSGRGHWSAHPSAAPLWCSDGERPTATGTQDSPFMWPAFDPKRGRL